MAIAVQTAVGEIGSKATTELTYQFNSMLSNGGFQYGCNGNGIFLLNSGELDNGSPFSRTVTFATTDLGEKNPKRARFVYIGFDAASAITLSVKIDDQSWRDYAATPLKTGLQRLRVPIGRDGQGRYFTFKITATTRFRIDSVGGMFIIRSTGIKGY